MKAIAISMIAAGLLASGSVIAADAPAAGAVATTVPFSVEAPASAKKNNCTACHAIYRRLVGPAWLEVSKKYKGITKFTYAGKEYSLQEGLMMKVSKGGAGSWGLMPMPANDAAGSKQADIKELVTFVIGLEKAEADRAAAKKLEAEKAAAKKAETKK
jgi:cytochrome c